MVGWRVNKNNFLLLVKKKIFAKHNSADCLIFSFKTPIFLGPDLPEACTYSSMVTSPSGQGVILFGCNENPIGEHFYELTNENGNFSWKIMEQKMIFPRSGATAMLLPDELVTCM